MKDSELRLAIAKESDACSFTHPSVLLQRLVSTAEHRIQLREQATAVLQSL